MKGLRDKVAIVTGGSSGIGQAIAIRLGQEGVHVGVNYVGPIEGAEQTIDAIDKSVEDCLNQVRAAGANAVLAEADVSNEREVESMFKAVSQALGPVDFLVNNAGIQIAHDSETLTAADFDKVLGVNLRGSFLCAQRAIREMLDDGRGGAIVNVSSVHEEIPKPKFLGYSVSKGGMRNLTRTLALEYAGRNIRVNAIGPGATVTPINRAWIDDPEKRALVTAHIPMGRAGDAEEMAAAAAFLLSDEAGYITGQTLFVDGGPDGVDQADGSPKASTRARRRARVSRSTTIRARLSSGNSRCRATARDRAPRRAMGLPWETSRSSSTARPAPTLLTARSSASASR
jgi:glucose 1-dehydrogenase